MHLESTTKYLSSTADQYLFYELEALYSVQSRHGKWAKLIGTLITVSQAMHSALIITSSAATIVPKKGYSSGLGSEARLNFRAIKGLTFQSALIWTNTLGYYCALLFRKAPLRRSPFSRSHSNSSKV